MPPQLFIPLITQVGVPLAEKLLTIWENGTNVTSAQFQSLIGSASVTARQTLINQLNAAGVPLTDPHAVSLLALVT